MTEPLHVTAPTPLSMWAVLAKHGVPQEYRGQASLALAEFIDAHSTAADEAAGEWRAQRSAAFPHAHGEGPLAGRCLTCADPWPCDGYYQDREQATA